jgi:hypothetical protein
MAILSAEVSPSRCDLSHELGFRGTGAPRLIRFGCKAGYWSLADIRSQIFLRTIFSSLLPVPAKIRRPPSRVTFCA